MILIADSGGTKVEWCLVDGGSAVRHFETPGMHALMLTQQQLSQRIAGEVVPQIADSLGAVTHAYFYGAGCVSPEVCASVQGAILDNIPGIDVEVATDLLGTARALCGDHPGIVCILGTGSNSCLYDGRRIVDNVSPLGFILGDEGSGAYLGKTLVGDVLKRQLPPEICEKFLSRYGLDAVQIVQRVYREPYPNRFLASLTPFLSENIGDPAIRALVIRGFKAFFERNVCLYNVQRQHVKVNFGGSVAFHFRRELAEAAAGYGFSIGSVIRNPIDGLIEYHSATEPRRG